jgi:hypothetical protein
MMLRFHRNCLFAVVSAAIVSLAAGGASDGGTRTPDARRGPIRGTFIQYQDWMMKMDAGAWGRELDAMRRAGIDLVVIQWLRMNDSRFIPSDPAAVDPTRIILEYADTHGMRVFIGLAYADLWWTRLRDQRYLTRAAVTSIRVAGEAWARYGKHPSFAGWYLPQELRDANYPPQIVDALRNFLKGLGDRCRDLSGGKRVAISPSMSGLIAPEMFGRIYTSLLRGSGIDIVIFQDGVGARGWGADLEQRIVPYFGAMRAACRTARVTLWSDIEIFHHAGKPSKSEPASIDRIKRQIAAESPFVSGFVMFDFFHYMSPARGDAQKKLYEDYLRELASPSRPSR